MKLTILLGIVALAISGVAAYFSIVGLAAIFAAALIPVIIMGSVVEAGKLASVAWVHFNWDWATRRLKYSLTAFIIAVMILTSVGVFGFLSRAHVEQTAAADESVAQVERIEKELVRQENIIERAEIKIQELESGTFKQDTAVQDQIDKEQERINSAYERIQPAIDEQNAIIAEQTQLFEEQIVAIDAELAKLQEYIDAGEIKKAQQLIGEKSPGGWGPKTTETANKWRAERKARKDQLLKQIQEATQNNPNIVAARDEIQRLRSKAEQQIADSNALINRLRDKIANSQRADNTDELLDEQYARVKSADKEIETLTDEKYKLEAAYRQLEAEVGPIKYIAEFVYGEEADKSLLEKAVKWVIILLLFVLDPFAVVLVMAATDGYKRYMKEKEVTPLTAKKENKKIAELQKELEARNLTLSTVEEDLADAKHEADALFGTIEQRNKELWQARLDLQEAQKQGLGDEDLEVIESLVKERDELLRQLEEKNIDLEVLAEEISNRKEPEINTVVMADEAVIEEINKLQEDKKALERKVHYLQTSYDTLIKNRESE